MLTKDNITVSPTKRLFIKILTQDITLEAGILDLIDNSVDSYIRNAFTDRRRIDLTINTSNFSIEDTCGGIKLDVLKEQVFRFGPKEENLDNPTLGMYGIGLKRSIFKMGDLIDLETHDGHDYSIMKLNVPIWQSDDKEWNIPFETEQSTLNTAEKPYTKILVAQLHDEVASKFGSVVFMNDLIQKIKRTYCLVIKDHIDITVNGKPVEPYELSVQGDDQYKPSVIVESYNGIDIRIICFVDPNPSRLKDAIQYTGWNLFCNKRLILANDTSELTGWKTSVKGDKSSLPRYHSLFNEFRGIVFLESNDPFKLPLNTSKTQLNTENASYHYILSLMVKAARPVIDYIYEKHNKESEALEAIEEEVKNSEDVSYNPQSQPITNFNTNSSFDAPKPEVVLSKTTRISYSVKREIFETVRKNLEVKTNKEVGEATFNYYVSMEL